MSYRVQSRSSESNSFYVGAVEWHRVQYLAEEGSCDPSGQRASVFADQRGLLLR